MTHAPCLMVQTLMYPLQRTARMELPLLPRYETECGKCWRTRGCGAERRGLKAWSADASTAWPSAVGMRRQVGTPSGPRSSEAGCGRLTAMALGMLHPPVTCPRAGVHKGPPCPASSRKNHSQEPCHFFNVKGTLNTKSKLGSISKFILYNIENIFSSWEEVWRVRKDTKMKDTWQCSL